MMSTVALERPETEENSNTDSCCGFESRPGYQPITSPVIAPQPILQWVMA